MQSKVLHLPLWVWEVSQYYTAFDQRLHPPFFCLSGKLKWHMSTRTFSWSSQPKTFTRHILVTQLVFSHLLSQFSVSFHNNAFCWLHEIFEIFFTTISFAGIFAVFYHGFWFSSWLVSNVVHLCKRSSCI